MVWFAWLCWQGVDWGENGYVRLSRVVNATDPKGMCGLFLYSQYPTMH